MAPKSGGGYPFLRSIPDGIDDSELPAAQTPYSTSPPYPVRALPVPLLPHIAELQGLFDALDASAVIAELHSYRRRAYRWRTVGRRGYGPEALWRAYVASFHLNLNNTNDLIRRLQEDPALAELCGFGEVLPHRTTFNRFIRRLASHAEAIETCLAGLTERLKACYPDLGREVAIDSSVVEAYGNHDRKTDPDASWTAKTNPNTGEEGMVLRL